MSDNVFRSDIDLLTTNVPPELQALRQWMCWKAVPRDDGTFSKPPHSPHSGWKASKTDPANWGTFDQAIALFRRDSSISGIGMVFTRGCGYVGLDVDDIDGVKPEYLEKRRDLDAQIDAKMVTYGEFSPSGRGKHFIMKGVWGGINGCPKSDIKMEIYAWDTFLTFTGNVIDEKRKIIECGQAFIDGTKHLFDKNKPVVELEPFDDGEGRELGLSDDEVMARASKYPDFEARYNSQKDCNPGEWHKTFYYVICKLDLQTGLGSQVRRLVARSPMVTDAPPAVTGETRQLKFERDFDNAFFKARATNADTVFGRRMADQFIACWEREMAARAEEIAAAMTATANKPDGMSKNAKSVQSIFDKYISHEHKALMRPPGMVGRICEEVEKASFLPFMKFALPATFAYLGGILGRGYKLPSGDGLTVNLLLITYSASGKTDAISAISKINNAAMTKVSSLPSGEALDCLIQGSTSSAQIMTPEFMQKPSCTWMIDEAGTQLKKMSKPNNETDENLRNMFNLLFDRNKFCEVYREPRSIRGSSKDTLPVPNLCVSTFWVTTHDKFKLTAGDAVDGYLSRVIIIRHKGEYGEVNESSIKYKTPDWLVDIIADHINSARYLNDNYVSVKEENLFQVSTEEVDKLHFDLVKEAQNISKSANREDLPPIYTAVSRLAVNALRIAGIMAVMENRFRPVVTIEQYKWAFGYVLQNSLNVLSDMDSGEIGDGAGDCVATIVRAVKSLLRRNKSRKIAEDGIPWSVLRDQVKGHKAFLEHKLGPGQGIEMTLEHMGRTGMIRIEQPDTTKRGPKPRFIFIDESDSVWEL